MHAIHAVVDAVAAMPLDIPNPGNGSAPPGAEKFQTVMGWAKWVALGVVIIGLFIIGAKLAIESRRGEGSSHLGSLGMAMSGVIVIAGATGLVGFLVS